MVHNILMNCPIINIEQRGLKNEDGQSKECRL